jgi:large subunit ribosomal protein L18
MKTLKRRKLEGRTDYKARLNLLKSEIPRLVVRKSNRFITAQIVSSETAQDKVLFGVNSKMLLSKGWPKELEGSLKNRSAAYLTGLMLGKMAKGKIEEAILDFGMNRNVHKSRIYAVLKGVIDAGIKVRVSEEVLPTVEELKAVEKTKSIFDKVKEAI